ncbi:monooxygenase [Xanthobacteraceae bacterium Astr-EGSB]|uniref:monooxygenase n=1 Tax=Astrobacterium formosum TaxID=3069710 RepID=UPI0027B26B7B|nr:monooxygenase [Xanthobacteraceae bacterium Astr-EGSB]
MIAPALFSHPAAPEPASRRRRIVAGAFVAAFLVGTFATASFSQDKVGPTSTTLVQFDFPSDGPWGEANAARHDEMAKDIAGEDGLIWKIWTENEAERRAGGVYLFRDAKNAERYRQKHEARLTRSGVRGIVARTFTVNIPLSGITRAPL